MLFPILTDLEFKMGTPGSKLNSNDFEFRLIYGFSDLIPFYLFYKIVQRYFLEGKKTILIAIIIVPFLIVFHFYSKISYYIIYHSPFLSYDLRHDAFESLSSNKSLTFSIVHIFTRLLCILALAYFIKFDQQSKLMRMLKEEQLHNELKYLKAQLHPHFFFNTLNNIYSLALKQSLDTAPLVAKLADMMRYILYESDSEKVPLKKEVNFVSNYIDTEKIRHQSKIIIEYHVQGNTDNRLIEPLLLLPFIENAFKHGIQNELYEGSVSVNIRIDENEINMEVFNTKAANEKAKPSGGVGLGNIHKRLNLLYKGRHILNVVDEPDSYSVNLTLQNI